LISITFNLNRVDNVFRRQQKSHDFNIKREPKPKKNESFTTKHMHCCLLPMSERRTCAHAECVAACVDACRACRAVLPNTCDTARHDRFSC